MTSLLGGTLSTAVAVVGLAGALSSAAGATAAVAATPGSPVHAGELAATTDLAEGTDTMTFSTTGRPSHVDVAPSSSYVRVRPQVRDARVWVTACDVPWSADGSCSGRTTPLVATTAASSVAGGLQIGVEGGAHLQVGSSGDVAWVLSPS